MELKIKERPILFSGPMVRAILSSQKTQTRRIYKLPKGMQWYVDGSMRGIETGDYCSIDAGDLGWWNIEDDTCPYGQPGHRLWVRETWATDLHNEQDSPSRIKELCEDAGYRVDPGHPAGPIWYQSDGAVRRWGDFVDVQGRWRPSIHMPRWASRITLEITNIRVERLQDITEVDAQAEGVKWPNPEVPEYGVTHPTCIDAFRGLWESINGPGSWKANPWVWVVEFQRVTEWREI